MIKKIKNLRKIKKVIKKLCNKCKASAVTSIQYNTFEQDHKNIWCENCIDNAMSISEYIDDKTIKRTTEWTEKNSKKK